MATNSGPAEIRSVFLPLHSGKLLLPNAAVTEVVSYQTPEPLANTTAEWLLGQVDWRKQKVPLVCFDRLAGQPAVDAGSRARIAISNTLNGNPERPFIAILLHAVPHLVRVSSENIDPLEVQKKLGGVVEQQVMVNGEEVWIPNLDILEWLVSEQL